MAKKLTLEYLPTVDIPDAYAMIGETRINHFHETCEVDVYIFASEDARHQRVEQAELRRPLKIITIKPPIHLYQEYLETAAKALAAAGYKLVTEVREGSAVNPFGLATMLTNAEDV